MVELLVGKGKDKEKTIQSSAIKSLGQVGKAVFGVPGCLAFLKIIFLCTSLNF